MDTAGLMMNGAFFQVMRDPTMLRQTGHTFEREVGSRQQQTQTPLALPLKSLPHVARLCD